MKSNQPVRPTSGFTSCLLYLATDGQKLDQGTFIYDYSSKSAKVLTIQFNMESYLAGQSPLSVLEWL